MPDYSDDELLVSGDPEDFAEFFRRHARTIERYFARRTSDAELAADLTAETFAAALLAARRFEPGGRPALAWLYGIAHHKLVDHRRRAGAEQRAEARLRAEPGAYEDAYDIDDGQLLRLVDELPEDQRLAVRGHVIEERTYEELAGAAGASEAVVRKRVSRGLAALRVAAVAAAVALVALVAVALDGDERVAVETPAASSPLEGVYDRSPRPDRGHVLLITGEQFTILRRNGEDFAFDGFETRSPGEQRRGLGVRSGRLRVRGATATFDRDAACGATAGRYRFARVAGQLRFTAVDDPCPGRRAVLEGVSWVAR